MCIHYVIHYLYIILCFIGKNGFGLLVQPGQGIIIIIYEAQYNIYIMYTHKYTILVLHVTKTNMQIQEIASSSNHANIRTKWTSTSLQLISH